MTPEQFIEKWKASTRTEKSASQEHFLDLCELLEVPKPGDVDTHGTEYTLEKAVKKPGGGSGSADVWKKGCFAWEYKGDRKNLSPPIPRSRNTRTPCKIRLSSSSRT